MVVISSDGTPNGLWTILYNLRGANTSTYYDRIGEWVDVPGIPGMKRPDDAHRERASRACTGARQLILTASARQRGWGPRELTGKPTPPPS